MPDSEISTRKKNIVDEIIGLYHGGRGSDLVTARGTAWGAFNAVSEYIEHERPVRGVHADYWITDSRLASSFFGNGAKLESKAWNKALSLV